MLKFETPELVVERGLPMKKYGIRASPISCLSPRTIAINGFIYIQRVCRRSPKPTDALLLQERLNCLMVESGDSESSELSSLNECFLEAIRQVSLSCEERGLLLAQILAEFSQRIDNYRKVTESALAFGLRARTK